MMRARRKFEVKPGTILMQNDVWRVETLPNNMVKLKHQFEDRAIIMSMKELLSLEAIVNEVKRLLS